MRAIYLPESGQSATLGDIPAPTPAAGEVLHPRSSRGPQIMEHRYPLVLGRDASGVVEAVGDGVKDVTVGDEVLAHVPFTSPFDAGTIAEYATLPVVSGVTAKPEGLDFVSAAALPLAGGAALALVDAIGPLPGLVVLVNGASGGSRSSCLHSEASPSWPPPPRPAPIGCANWAQPASSTTPPALSVIRSAPFTPTGWTR